MNLWDPFVAEVDDRVTHTRLYPRAPTLSHRWAWRPRFGSGLLVIAGWRSSKPLRVQILVPSTCRGGAGIAPRTQRTEPNW